MHPCQDIYVGAVESNSGSHACTANAFTDLCTHYSCLHLNSLSSVISDWIFVLIYPNFCCWFETGSCSITGWALTHSLILLPQPGSTFLENNILGFHGSFFTDLLASWFLALTLTPHAAQAERCSRGIWSWQPRVRYQMPPLFSSDSLIMLQLHDRGTVSIN